MYCGKIRLMFVAKIVVQTLRRGPEPYVHGLYSGYLRGMLGDYVLFRSGYYNFDTLGLKKKKNF